MATFSFEYTDTFAGQANYSWVQRGTVDVGDLVDYGLVGLDGAAKAGKRQEAHAVRKAKGLLGLSGVRARREVWGDTIVLRFPRLGTILFIECEK